MKNIFSTIKFFFVFFYGCSQAMKEWPEYTLKNELFGCLAVPKSFMEESQTLKNLIQDLSGSKEVNIPFNITKEDIVCLLNYHIFLKICSSDLYHPYQTLFNFYPCDEKGQKIQIDVLKRWNIEDVIRIANAADYLGMMSYLNAATNVIYERYTSRQFIKEFLKEKNILSQELHQTIYQSMALFLLKKMDQFILYNNTTSGPFFFNKVTSNEYVHKWPHLKNSNMSSNPTIETHKKKIIVVDEKLLIFGKGAEGEVNEIFGGNIISVALNEEENKLALVARDKWVEELYIMDISTKNSKIVYSNCLGKRRKNENGENEYYLNFLDSNILHMIQVTHKDKQSIHNYRKFSLLPKDVYQEVRRSITFPQALLLAGIEEVYASPFMLDQLHAKELFLSFPASYHSYLTKNDRVRLGPVPQFYKALKDKHEYNKK